MHKRTLML